MIKVIHVLHAVGGVDVYLRLLLAIMDHNKFEHIIIKGENDTHETYFRPDGKLIKVYKLPIDREINFIEDFKSISQVVKIFKNERPDIVHAHSAKGGIIARSASVFYKVNVLHTPHAYSYLSADYGFKRRIFLFIEKFYKHINSKLLATSNSEINRGLIDVGYKEEDVYLFNNSILPIEEIKPLKIKKTWPDNYICSVGRPSFQKNIELMLDVLFEVKKQENDIHLVLMGVGYHSPNLLNVKNLIQSLGLENNVTLLDWTNREDIFYIIKHSALYISTARYEGLPYSVIESLALGKPIVATKVDGNQDLVKHNYNGFLVENENATEMSSFVLKLLNDKTLFQTFSENSKLLFEENFNMKNNIKDLECIYENNIK
ncbi:glycosyltransferase family 4 protein [Formosa sediminum]|uniref:Glycosyltransferase family 4 protein n=1 Tax=Formosa sediminum TaxID=2594004 RepID=A0A516GPE6_9FLAO|nr:glycosyltransferase [Formosa sediminum]QDO93230.1 glycosyltransferase family 4 protein [Formosa sediminum]